MKMEIRVADEEANHRNGSDGRKFTLKVDIKQELKIIDSASGPEHYGFIWFIPWAPRPSPVP